MSEPFDARVWVMDHAEHYRPEGWRSPLSPAEMYVLLVLALASDPPWEEIPPDERAEIVGWWFALTSCVEQVRLLNVQQIALGDYRADKRRASHG